MKRSRTRSNLVWLTLVAFSVQLAVAVLHHHVARGTGIESRAITAGLCAPSNRNPCVPAPHPVDHDGCVFCWAAAVAATSLASSVPELPLPSKFASVRLVIFEAVPARRIHRENFQARGPPAIAA
jgi:hypothetical protein